MTHDPRTLAFNFKPKKGTALYKYLARLGVIVRLRGKADKLKQFPMERLDNLLDYFYAAEDALR